MINHLKNYAAAIVYFIYQSPWRQPFIRVTYAAPFRIVQMLVVIIRKFAMALNLIIYSNTPVLFRYVNLTATYYFMLCFTFTV